MRLMASQSTSRVPASRTHPGAGRSRRPRSTSLLRAYPAWWRARYGEEMAVLLETRPLDLRWRVDLLRGAFDAHLRGDEPAAARGVAAALVAGGAWTITGLASTAAAAPPDWPGYLVETLPIALIGAVAGLLASLGLARRGWLSNDRSLESAIVATIIGHLVWAVALVAAIVGGPYGAITAIAGSAAALSTIGLGLALYRTDARPAGGVLVSCGALLLVPSPAVWLVVGAAWTGIGVWRLVGTGSSDTPGREHG